MIELDIGEVGLSDDELFLDGKKAGPRVAARIQKRHARRRRVRQLMRVGIGGLEETRECSREAVVCNWVGRLNGVYSVPLQLCQLVITIYLE